MNAKLTNAQIEALIASAPVVTVDSLAIAMANRNVATDEMTRDMWTMRINDILDAR